MKSKIILSINKLYTSISCLIAVSIILGGFVNVSEELQRDRRYERAKISNEKYQFYLKKVREELSKLDERGQDHLSSQSVNSSQETVGAKNSNLVGAADNLADKLWNEKPFLPIFDSSNELLNMLRFKKLVGNENVRDEVKIIGSIIYQKATNNPYFNREGNIISEPIELKYILKDFSPGNIFQNFFMFLGILAGTILGLILFKIWVKWIFNYDAIYKMKTE